MKQPIYLSESVAKFNKRLAAHHATNLVNRELTGEHLVDTVGWNDQLMSEVLEVLADEIRASRAQGEVVMTAFGADVEPSAEFYRGVEDGMKSSRICGVMAGLVGFACGALLPFLLPTIGGAS